MELPGVAYASAVLCALVAGIALTMATVGETWAAGATRTPKEARDARGSARRWGRRSAALLFVGAVLASASVLLAPAVDPRDGAFRFGSAGIWAGGSYGCAVGLAMLPRLFIQGIAPGLRAWTALPMALAGGMTGTMFVLGAGFLGALWGCELEGWQR
ncbi:MAG: hypothetical protein AB7O97_15225 [Planctomycetota bacterium]